MKTPEKFLAQKRNVGEKATAALGSVILNYCSQMGLTNRWSNCDKLVVVLLQESNAGHKIQ